MKDFDYIIIGGGCAGLSLAFELDIHSKLKDKSLAIIEPRNEYKKDKTWSFWKVASHNFDDCVKKSWDNFTINIPNHLKHIECKNMPYQSIDSGLFYQKIIDKLKQNNNVHFFKNINEVNTKNSFIFNSVSETSNNKSNLWQHFSGLEIETSKDLFDETIFNLMDFDCDQKNSVHFFYTLPYSKKKALIETTWISDLNNASLKDYDTQLKDYIENKLKIKNYKINFQETGAIPLFHPTNIKKLNQIEIGTAGGMTRLSTGYTFLNIQAQSRYIRKNIENIKNAKIFSIEKKYQFLDNIFLKVLKNNPDKMAKIFYKMFNCSPNTVINFLSNKSNILEDVSIISKMPKWIFFKTTNLSMSNEIKKINLNHSFVFFLFSNIFSLIIFKFNNFNISPLICLLLILTIGVSHGSLDHVKGKRLFNILNIEKISIFYFLYILIAISVIIIWILAPSISLIIFLLVASFHFGKEDTQFLINENSKLNQFLFFFKGLLIILAPIYFHFNETIAIFKFLLVDNEMFYSTLEFIEINKILPIGIILSTLSSVYLFVRKFEIKKFTIFLDYFSILILNYYLSPLVAFTIYFCFLHSIRHSITLVNELDKNDFINGLKVFGKKALPLTVLTAFFCLIGFYLLNDSYSFNSSILKIIFIGLASLTFPHILLEYFLEKNEK